MAKLTLNDIASGYSATSKINANSTLIEAAIENTLSRDGTGPNEMLTNLDMNGFRIINLPNAVSNSEPVTLGQASTIAGVENPFNATTVGEVLYPRSDEEIAASVTPTHYQYAWGDVRRYGALGNGSTDDSAAIQAALNTGHPVVFQNKTYYIATGLTWNTDYTIIHANGARLTTDQDIIGLLIGAFGVNAVLQGCRIFGNLYLINASGTSTKAGFEFRQVYEGRFEISAQGWEKGLHLTSEDAGTVYNELYLGRVIDNNYGIHLNPTSNGWVNENNFYGGRFACGSGSKQYLVYAPDSGSTYGRPNNNKFFGPSFENGASSTLVGAVFDAGVQNSYHSPRIEMGGTVTDIDFCFGSRAVGGTLLLPYASYQEGSATNIRDDGIESIIWGTDRFKQVSRQASPASPVHEIWRHDGNNNLLPTQLIADAYNAYLVDNHIVAIDGIDTRALVAHIRTEGAMNCIISSEDVTIDSARFFNHIIIP
jgi:hypothetical protein